MVRTSYPPRRRPPAATLALRILLYDTVRKVGLSPHAFQREDPIDLSPLRDSNLRPHVLRPQSNPLSHSTRNHDKY